MVDAYRIYGAEVSPYSVKVRAWFRYKQVPHAWIVRNAATQAEFERYARLPLIPLVVTPDDEGLQDSTPIIERLETQHPEPSIHPDGPVARFVSALLEEYGDEWGNKWMFHYRWAREVDQVAAAGRIARTMAPDADDAQHEGMAAGIRKRMTGRVGFVGSSVQTAPTIEASFREALGLLETHLSARPYLFGARPAFADLGLWPQLYECWTDPTSGALMEGRAPRVLAWLQRMTWPRAEGAFEPWEALEPTLAPLLELVGRQFVPWTLANEAAIAAGRDEMTAQIDGAAWTQKPQKYHAKTLAALREKHAAAGEREALDALLERTGCLAAFR